MRIFRINEKIEISCEWQKTRQAFRHVAVLLFNGVEQERTKVCYLNRTWESYEYQTVAKRLVEKSTALTDEEKKICNDFLDGDRTDWSQFKAVSMVAKMGDLLCSDQKEKNDWKARMLKAGLESKGLVMPDDWDSLDEDTKQARLDLILKTISGFGENNDKNQDNKGN